MTASNEIRFTLLQTRASDKKSGLPCLFRKNKPSLGLIVLLRVDFKSRSNSLVEIGCRILRRKLSVDLSFEQSNRSNIEVIGII